MFSFLDHFGVYTPIICVQHRTITMETAIFMVLPYGWTMISQQKLPHFGNANPSTTWPRGNVGPLGQARPWKPWHFPRQLAADTSVQFGTNTSLPRRELSFQNLGITS
jgi:hypothetical protein